MSAPPLTPLFLLHPLLGYGIPWGQGIPLGIRDPFGTWHPFGTRHPLGTPHHGTGCHVERSRGSPTPPPPPGHPTRGQRSPGAPGSPLPAGAGGQAGCAGASPSTIWFPTNKRPALAPGRGLAAAAAAAAVYSVPRLWHGPAESPSAFPPAARACKAPAPRPCPCPTSVSPGALWLSRGCPSLGCPRGFSRPVCVMGWDAQYGGRVGAPTRFLLSGCWLGGVVPPIPSLHPKKLPTHPWGRPGGVPKAGGRSPGPPPRVGAPPAAGAAEPPRRVGAARSHLPLIEFICYNPKQCKAGFSQAPAAWLPIKIPSRTANPPSRLDIKQPVSTERQAKPPQAPAIPRAPSRSPGAAVPRGLRARPQIPSRVALGDTRGTRSPGAAPELGVAQRYPTHGRFQSRWWPCAWGWRPQSRGRLGCPHRPHTVMLGGWGPGRGAWRWHGRAGMGLGQHPGGLGGHPEAPRPPPPHFTTCRAPGASRRPQPGGWQGAELGGTRRCHGAGGAVSDEVYGEQQLPGSRTGRVRRGPGMAGPLTAIGQQKC